MSMPDVLGVAPWGPLVTVDTCDATTWTIAETHLPGGWRVITSFNPTRFSPAWGLPGLPHHFETLVTATAEIGNSERTYATESEARSGHAAIVTRLRASLGGAA